MKSRHSSGSSNEADALSVVEQRWQADGYDCFADVIEDCDSLLRELTSNPERRRVMRVLREVVKASPDDADEVEVLLRAKPQGKARVLTRKQVDAELAKLPEPARMAIDLHIFNGMSVAECAKELKMSQTAFRALFKASDAEFNARLERLRNS